MNNFTAERFNKKASDQKSQPDKIVKSLALQPGHYVADLGTGGGYFSMRFAEAVGDRGKVYAVDINQDFLDFVRSSAKIKGFYNVETIFAAEDRFNLPEKSMDLIFIREVTRHLPDRAEYFTNLKYFLKEKGRIAIIEQRRGGLSHLLKLSGNYIPKEVIVQRMGKAGYRLDKDFDFLPGHSFTIYSKKKIKKR